MTPASFIEPLMREWSNFEPHNCSFDVDQGEWRIRYMGISNAKYASLLDHALIQGAVQQAIEERGWLWWFPNHYHQGRYCAGIRVGRRVFYTPHGFFDGTPAGAILSAYLQALRAQ